MGRMRLSSYMVKSSLAAVGERARMGRPELGLPRPVQKWWEGEIGKIEEF